MKLTRKYHFRYMGLWIMITVCLLLILNIVLYLYIHERWKSTLEMSGGLDEAAIKTLASHLVELWKLNPDLFLWIHQNLTGQEIVDAEGEDGG